MSRQIRSTVNSIELIGWLGNAPEQRTITSGTVVCNFSVATKRISGRTDQGEQTFETDWTPVEAWDRLAEQCGRSLHKGSRVRVSGSLTTRSWEDRESGQRRSKTFVRAEAVMFLDAKPEGNGQDMSMSEAVEDSEEVPF